MERSSLERNSLEQAPSKFEDKIRDWIDLCEGLNKQIQSLAFDENYFRRDRDSSLGIEAIEQLFEATIEPQNQETRFRMKEEYFGNGPLAPLLDDPSVTEIIVNEFDSIWFERCGLLIESSDYFLSLFTFERFLRKLFLELGQEPTITHPFIDGEWLGNRIHLVGSYGYGPRQIRMTLRKHKREAWTLQELGSKGWASESTLEYLRSLMKERKNLLVIGPTGSGKTSVLKALLNECEVHERVVIIEDSREIQPPNPSSTHLLTRFDAREVLPPISLADLVRQSLRMRPDRVVVGEVRGGEAKDLLMALATGHSGSAGTLHASDAGQALIRLEMLIQMGAPQWSLQAIRRLIQLSLDYIIVCEKSPQGHRALEGLYRLVSVEESGVIIEKVFC